MALPIDAALSPGATNIDPALLSQLQGGGARSANGLTYVGWATGPGGVLPSGEDAIGNSSITTGGYVSFNPANAQPDSWSNTYSTDGQYTGQVYVPGVSTFDKVVDTVVDVGLAAAFAYAGAGATGLIDAPATAAADSVATGASAGSSGLDASWATGFTDTGTAGGALDTAYAGSAALTGATGLVSPITNAVTSTAGSTLTSTAGSTLTSGLTSTAGKVATGVATTLLGGAATGGGSGSGGGTYSGGSTHPSVNTGGGTTYTGGGTYSGGGASRPGINGGGVSRGGYVPQVAAALPSDTPWLLIIAGLVGVVVLAKVL